MSVLGLGLDLVGLAAFELQLADTASGFIDATFTSSEQRDARSGPGRRVERLAGRFAAKEAFVKAWGSARLGRTPALDPSVFDLREIEVCLDSFGRPSMRLHGAVEAAFGLLVEADAHGTGRLPQVHVSITHDPPVAAAVVVIEESR